MTGADIVPLHPQLPAQAAERDVVDGWLPVVSDVIKLANVIASTSFVPEVYRDNPPAVAAAILTGRELGIGPLMALRHVQMVKGTPVLSAEYKRARVLSAGHEFDILELTTQRCRVSGRRRGSSRPAHEVTFTMDDAARAGLVKDKSAWKTRPRRMLFARASSELCDFLFSDVVNGLPTAELLSEDGDGYGGYDEPATATAPARTARRRTVKTPAAGGDTPGHRDVPPSPGGAHPAPAGASGTGAGRWTPADSRAAGAASPRGAQPPPPQDQPPLPGEEPGGDETPAAEGGEARGEPASPLPGQPPGDTAAGVTGPQQAKLHAMFARLGFGRDDREGRLAVASEITGRELATSSDLTRDEARALIDTLSAVSDRDHLIALLAQASGPAGGQPADPQGGSQ